MTEDSDRIITPRTNFKKYASLDRLTDLPKEPITVLLQVADKVDIIEMISNSKKLSDVITDESIICCRVDGVLKNMDYIIEKNCEISGYSSHDPEGKRILWNTAGMLLNIVIRRKYTKSAYYHVNEKSDGFYCNVLTDRPFSDDDYAEIIDGMHEEMKRDNYHIMDVPCNWAGKILDGSWDQKSLLVNRYGVNDNVTVYRLGNFVGANFNDDPLLPNFDLIKHFKIVKNSLAHFDNRMPCQRLYGIAFSSQEELDNYDKA